MAWTRLQSASASQASNNVASFGVAFTTANVSAGTKLICAVEVCGNGSAVTTSNVKDGAGNTFTKITSRGNNNSTTSGELSLWAIDTPAGDVGTKPTITATFSVSTNAGIGILVQEVSGLAPGSTLAAMFDGAAGVASGTSGATTSGSPVYRSTAQNEYLVAVFGDNGSGGSCTWTKPAALTADPNAINTHGDGDVGFAYGNTVGGTEAGNWSMSASNQWSVILGAFKLAPVWNIAQPARTRIPQIFPRGRVTSGRGAPVSNPVPPVVTVFQSATQPARARVLQVFPRGRAASNGATPVHNPVSGPVFRQATSPARARIPQVFSKGRANPGPGAPAAHAGPAVYPLQGPARARLPQLHPRAGRGYGNAGAPVHNPSSGPAVRPLAGPVQARRPLFLLGRAESRPGAPPVHAGPSVTPLTRPAQARRPLPPRGRVYGNRGAPVQNPAPPVTAPAYRLTSPVRAKPQVLLTGRAATMAALPAPQNPSAGPAFSLPAQPAQARRPLPPRGRTYGSRGAPVNNPAPPVVQVPAQRLTSPVRARLPRPLTGRAITSHAVALQAPVYAQQVLSQPAGVLVYLLRAGHVQASVQTSPVHNPPPPSTTPVVPLTSPAGVRVIFARTGSGAGSPGAPVQNPQQQGAPLYPLTQPVQARRPLPAPGRAATMAMLPSPVAPPATIPPPPPLTSPVRTRIVLPPRGRTYGSRGAPVNNPAQTSGPPFPPLRQAVRARQPLPRRGRDYLSLPYKAPVNPVPGSGPPFPPLTSPAGLRVVFNRIGAGSGSPGIFTAPVVTPAKFYPQGSVRARPGTFSKGRASGNAGAPVHNPVTGQGPPFYPQGTVRFRITLPPRGRGYGSKGAPVIHTGPAVRPLTSPVRAPVPQPFSKGRAAGNPGAPVHNPPSTLAPVYPQGKALHAQPAVFLKGRATGNAGAPVHNPTRGPVFRQATQPARYRIVLPPPGRVYGNPGGPIVNPVEGPVPPGTLYLTPGTIIQGRPYAATTISTPGGVLTITSAMTGVTVITPAAEGYAASAVTPPPDSDIPPPDPAVVPAYAQR